MLWHRCTTFCFAGAVLSEGELSWANIQTMILLMYIAKKIYIYLLKHQKEQLKP